ESLASDLQTIQNEYQEAHGRYTAQMQKLKEEQDALEADHAKRMVEFKVNADQETATLQTQVNSLEHQRNVAERDLETLRQKWQEEVRAKDQALKEAQNAIAPQEAELRKRYESEEDAVSRQVDGLKSRLRTLERDLARTRENIEKAEKENSAV